MLDWIGPLAIIEQNPDVEYTRCCVDMLLSIPQVEHWVVVPGVFVSEGKPDDMKFDDYFEPIKEAIRYDGTVPEGWLLVATCNDRHATEEDMSLATKFITDINKGRLRRD